MRHQIEDTDDDDFDFDSTVRPKSAKADKAGSTAWESLQDMVLQKTKKRAQDSSQESLLEDLEIFFEFAAAKPPTDSYLSIPRSTYAKSDAENEKSDYDNGDSANSSGSESDGNESDDDSEDETEETESESKTSDSNSRKKSNDSDKPERFGSLSLNIEKINSTSRASLKSLNNTASSDQTLNASKPSLRGSRINVKNSTSSKISVRSEKTT